MLALVCLTASIRVLVSCCAQLKSTVVHQAEIALVIIIICWWEKFVCNDTRDVHLYNIPRALGCHMVHKMLLKNCFCSAGCHLT